MSGINYNFHTNSSTSSGSTLTWTALVETFDAALKASTTSLQTVFFPATPYQKLTIINGSLDDINTSEDKSKKISEKQFRKNIDELMESLR